MTLSNPSNDDQTPDPTVIPLRGPKPSVTHMLVTPEMAARWLERNRVNRYLRRSRIAQYAGDMTAGRWTLSNDAICFGPDGVLLNGQHRLHAVIRSGCSILMLIARNMPPESMATMDSGAARTAADVLGFDGETHTQILAAAAKQAILYLDGRIYKEYGKQAVSHTAIQEFVAANPLLRHSVKTAAANCRKLDITGSPLAAAHWIIADHLGDPDLPDLYVESLSSRTNEPEGSAILAVDTRLREIRRTRGTYPPRAYIGLLVKGWNHWAADKKVTSLLLAHKSNYLIPSPSDWKRK